MMAGRRILVTGGEGQVGSALAAALSGRVCVAPGRRELDVTDAEAVARAVARHAPDVVIHAAALTDTTRCEREPDLAHRVNAAGTEHVARACAAAGARLFAISTNEVFDGARPDPYREGDVPHPLNAYGESKAAGERAAVAAWRDTAIVRTSWVYGAGGNNFVGKVLAAARRGGPLRFVTDEVASPTLAGDVAAGIIALVDAGAPPGVYHLVNEGAASRFAWAREVARLAGLDASLVEPTTTDALRAGGYDGPRKPPYSVLANEHARALGVTLRPWGDALAEHMRRAQVAADG